MQNQLGFSDACSFFLSFFLFSFFFSLWLIENLQVHWCIIFLKSAWCFASCLDCYAQLFPAFFVLDHRNTHEAYVTQTVILSLLLIMFSFFFFFLCIGAVVLGKHFALCFPAWRQVSCIQIYFLCLIPWGRGGDMSNHCVVFAYSDYFPNS